MEHSVGSWAEASLSRSFRRIALLAVIGWQLVAAVVSVPYGAGLTAAQLALALLAAGALWAVGRDLIAATSAVVAVLMVVLAAVSCVISGDLDSPLTLAACWQINFATCVATLVVLRNHVVAWMVICAAAVSVVILRMLPEWGAQLPISIVVTQAAIAVALRAGTAVLVARARRTDHDTAQAERLARREQVARRVNGQIAEEARVLHDTAINTLGAIAAGPWQDRDLGQIRSQCERDVVLLHDLRRERDHNRPARLADLFVHQRLPVDRSGLDDAALSAWDEGLAPATRSALVGCVAEAVTNAYKHAEVDRVQIWTGVVAGRLQVRVSDSGVGFDPMATRLRGIASSIVERGQDAGVDTVVDARPGQGTTITLTVGSPPEQSAPPSWADDTVDQVIGRAAGLWGLGATAVSIVLTVTGGTNQHNALWPMIAVMLVACAVPLVVRHRVAAVVILIVLTVTIFVLSSAATAFGTVGPSHWQALAPTSAAVTLLALRPGRSTVLLGATVWVGTVTVLAVAAQTPAAAALIIIAGTVGIGFSAAWLGFQHVVEQVTGAAQVARQRAFDAQLLVDAERAARRTYLRWVAAGLDGAIALLSDIAEAKADPADPEVIRACGAEETHLRQLVQIGPELVHLGAELMPVLRHAHDRRVPFTLRVGGVDTVDGAAARTIADLLRTVIDSSSSVATRLSASILPVRDQLQLTVTGPSLPGPGGAVAELGRVHTMRLGTIDIVELTCPGVPVHVSEEN